MRSGVGVSARGGVCALSRFSDGGRDRCESLQRRRARGHSEDSGEDTESRRQQDADNHGDTLRHHDYEDYRDHPAGKSEREDKDSQGGRLHGGYGADCSAVGTRLFVGQSDRRAVCVYRLRGEHLAQLLRGAEQEADIHHGEQPAQDVGGQHDGVAQMGVGDRESRVGGEILLHLIREDIY